MPNQPDITIGIPNRRNGSSPNGPTAWGLGNTNPLATRGPTLGLGRPSPSVGEAERQYPSGGLSDLARTQQRRAFDLVVGGLSQHTVVIEAKDLRAPAQRPAGQVALFQKIMEDWGFSDQEASILLGFESASHLHEIYLGVRPVGHRDANDRLRAVLRIAADVHALFRSQAAIRDWLAEPQRDLGDLSPRSLLTEGSMENLLRVKYYLAFLSGR